MTTDTVQTGLRPGSTSALELVSAVRELYEKAGKSDCVFASPLGPVIAGRRTLFLPQFASFGPHSNVDPVRLAVLSGIRASDRPGSLALLQWIHDLTSHPDIGPGLSVSIFPIVNVRELLTGLRTPDLSREDWSSTREPEIALLRENAKLRQYIGYFRISGIAEGEPSVVVRTALSATSTRSGIEVFTSDDFDPWPVRFESIGRGKASDGPLGFAAEAAISPFEVELLVPSKWDSRRWRNALVPLLKHLLAAYRGFFSFARNL